MGNSVIWFLPEGADRVARIDFGGRIQRRDGPFYYYPQSGQRTLSGIEASVHFHGRSWIRLNHVWQRDSLGTGDLLRRKLQALVAHLQQGGNCVYADDDLFAKAGFCTPPGSETGSVTIDSDLFSLISGAGSSTGREVVVQTDHDRYLIEHKLCATNTGLTFDLAQNVAQDMSNEAWCLVREFGSFPALKLPMEMRESGEFLTNDRERIFTLDLTLEEDIAQLIVMHAFGNPIPGEYPGGFDLHPDTDVELPDIKGGYVYR